MRHIARIAAGILLAGAATSLFAEGAPELAEGVKVEAAGEAIDVRVGHLVPWVLDWNEDGKKDLLVGQFLQGKIRCYENVGEDGAPVFKAFEYLKAGGKEISLPSG